MVYYVKYALDLILGWTVKMLDLSKVYIHHWFNLNLGPGHQPWWRHQMETFSALLALCAGNSGNFPHKGQWRGALTVSLMCVWTNGWVNNRDAGDVRRHCAHYDCNEATRNVYMESNHNIGNATWDQKNTIQTKYHSTKEWFRHDVLPMTGCGQPCIATVHFFSQILYSNQNF